MKPIRFKSVEYIRQPESNHELAKFLVSLELSGEETVEWVINELYLELIAPVADENGVQIDFDNVEIESMFGEDARRYVNGYKLWAFRMPRQLLQWRCVERVRWVWVARENYERRLVKLNR